MEWEGSGSVVGNSQMKHHQVDPIDVIPDLDFFFWGGGKG